MKLLLLYIIIIFLNMLVFIQILMLVEIITAHLKGWTLSRVPRVSLVALRLALAEMLYGDEQKPGVAINEAVELVKKYGAEDDYQFVNGLLGAVARERGETPEPQC